MPTTNPLLKRCAISLCALAMLVLCACSPGTGGTGTGPIAVVSPAPVASSYFTSGGAAPVTAAPLPPTGTTPTVTPPAATPAATPTAPGTPCTAGCISSQAVSLHLQADRIELSTPCATFTYAGAWSVSAAGDVTVQGVWESNVTVNGQTSRTSQSAILTLNFAVSLESSASVKVRIQDIAGQPLLGPSTLQRSASPPTAAVAGGC